MQFYLVWTPASDVDGAVPLGIHRDGPPLTTVGRLVTRYSVV